jgi:hypothetical protein
MTKQAGVAKAVSGTDEIPDEIIVAEGIRRYIHRGEFRRPGAAVRRRWDARPHDRQSTCLSAGRCELAEPEAGREF